MRLPRIDFHTGGLGCPICQKELPLPQSPAVRERTCDCGVVARLESESAVNAKWRMGLSIQPREGYRLTLPFREATGGEGYVVFEQSGAPMTIGRGHRQDAAALRDEGRRLRDELAQGRRSWWQRSLGGNGSS
jgi:hypothetical protein